MEDPALPDILEAHFEALIRYGAAKARLLENTPGLPAEAAGLFALVRRLQESLQPVRPEPTFRRTLGQQLVQEARRRHTRRVLGIPVEQAARALRPLWVLPVAALGTASLVGVGAYAYWRRLRHLAARDKALAA
ncbi:MAG: hypothetical protein RMN24_04680 [Anaerolineae bacterium]|nr:hypothetical protein [Caldilineales bacterium]MCX7853267.1 hypothetical protein [Caldilineales bacterium]MDW8268442.1 hypothetical protein [Anaerolineae bacterium]